MARRVSWTNNSSGHSGTYVYRGQTLDPLALPPALTTVDPVAAGVTAEWNDTESLPDGDYDYAVQDFDGSGTGDLSAVVTHTIGTATDFSTVAIGDEVEGGIYAGTITYADARQFHLISAKQSGEASGYQWRDGTYSNTNATSEDDGYANAQAVLPLGGCPMFTYCDGYVSDGFADWYPPALNELDVVWLNLFSAGHPEFSTDVGTYRWTSSESASGVQHVHSQEMAGGAVYSATPKTNTGRLTRPIRRVPV